MENPKCSFCQTPTVPIQLGGATFRACPHCHATFILAPLFHVIRRDVDETSRRLWSEHLAESAKTWSAPTEVPCLEHGHPLREGTLPELGITGLVSTCCLTLHLPPATLYTLLERGLQTPVPKLNEGHHHGFFYRIAKILDKHLGSSKSLEDSLDGMLWQVKLKSVYGTKVG
ncbi:MAG TPA: hypothetical protein VLM37_05295 [Fibrobacteraceae bacterium]|nr:hypothetical protein [Fibrobacteraceae bacterium]